MRKITTLIILLSLTLVGYSQDNHPVVFGQEMSKVNTDDNEEQYSVLEPNGYEVYGMNRGDTIYHNNIVTVNEDGYPDDFTYTFKKLNKNTN